MLVSVMCVVSVGVCGVCGEVNSCYLFLKSAIVKLNVLRPKV